MLIAMIGITLETYLMSGCTMIWCTILQKKVFTYYGYLYLPPTTPVWVDIFRNDDVILEKLGERSEFPKSSEKRLKVWFLWYQAYLREDICKNDEDIVG